MVRITAICSAGIIVITIGISGAGCQKYNVSNGQAITIALTGGVRYGVRGGVTIIITLIIPRGANRYVGNIIYGGVLAWYGY